ncbi:MAG: VCBS repeat-containing protein [Planctomycetaceae bacterium]|nr:VCBS repeat-containing protein [Planctomycetaceae bacterium]
MKANSNMNILSRRLLFSVCVCVSVVSPRLLSAEDEISSHFGFDGLEIYKVSSRSENLLAGDFNHDGKQDVLVVDNSKSRIDLFQQRNPDAVEQPATSNSVNEIVNDRRFEHRKLPVDFRIASLTVGDLNADGRDDIAYIGVPDRLIVLLQQEDSRFEAAPEIRLSGVSQSSWAIDAGDLNQDGKDDLVVLGKEETWILRQAAKGFERPEKLLNTSDQLAIARIVDLDGDGRNDLCYLAANGQETNFCARLQDEEGKLGAELQFDVKRQRSLTTDDVDGEPGVEILTIDPLTNRVKVLKLIKAEQKAGELSGKLVQYGFGGNEGARDRDLAIGDVDGDGRVDLVATDPAGAQVFVFRQQNGSGLDLGTAYPGLQGASQVRIGKTSPDGPTEVVTLSDKEKSIGISTMEDGRLSIPQVLPTAGEPVALEMADLTGDGIDEIIYVSRERMGRSSDYFVRILIRAGETWAHLAEEGLEVDLSSAPDRLSVGDLNQDGHPDFLISQGSERQQIILLSDEAGKLSIVEPGEGFTLGTVPTGAIYLGTQTDPAVIVSQENFARSFLLDEENRWKLLEQFNANEPNAKLSGSVLLNLDGQPGDEIVLVDTGVKRLRVLRKEPNAEQYSAWKEIELGDFPFTFARRADLNGDEQEDLLLFGGSRFAVLYAGRTDPELKEIAFFETALEKVFFADVVAGDVSHDGQTDLIVLDTRSHYLEILDYDADAGLRHALHFRIFEEKSFSSSDERGGSEPREGLVADVTGDGFNDLIILVHDRLIVYPQDK